MNSGVGSIGDDTADKVRRNLVVFSAVVIAIPALEAQIGGKFFGLESVEEISQWRAWLAVLTVLTYLFYRYSLDPKVEARRKKLRARRAKSSTEILTGLVHREFNNLADGIAPSGVKFDLSPLPQPDATFDKNGGRALKLTGPRAGQIEFDTHTSLSGQKFAAGVGFATFEVSRARELAAKIQAWRAHNKLDHEMLDLRFPFYISAIALLFTVINLTQALATSYSECRLWRVQTECTTLQTPHPSDSEWKLEPLKRSVPKEKTPPDNPAGSSAH